VQQGKLYVAKTALFLIVLFSFVFATPNGRCDDGIYWDQRPVQQRVQNVLNEVQDFSQITASVLEQQNIGLDDIYTYLSSEGGSKAQTFIDQLKNGLSSFAEVGVEVNRDLTKTITVGLEAAHDIMEIDSLHDFDTYLHDIIHSYPQSTLMMADVTRQILGNVLQNKGIRLDEFIATLEEMRPLIEDGVLGFGGKILNATIEYVGDTKLAEFDAGNNEMKINLTKFGLGCAALFWDNAAVTVDVSDVPLLAVDLRVSVDKNVKDGCYKIELEGSKDLTKYNYLFSMLGVDVKAGFGAEILVKPQTGIQQMINVNFKYASLEGVAGNEDAPIASAKLCYHMDKDALSSYGEVKGQPVWVYYDTTSNTWKKITAYSPIDKSGYFGANVDHLSTFTIVSSTDPVLNQGVSVTLEQLLFVVAGVAAGSLVLAVVVYTRRIEKKKRREGMSPTRA